MGMVEDWVLIIDNKLNEFDEFRELVDKFNNVVVKFERL